MPLNVSELIKKVKGHPDFSKAGMVLTHNGVVRESSRDGKPVSGLEINVDHDALESIVTRYRATPGIVDIQVELAEEKRFLSVGEDVMVIVVAGDIRERVIETLSGLLNEIKQTVTSKTEFYTQDTND